MKLSKGFCMGALHLAAWSAGAVVMSNIAQEGNRMLRCESGEVLMESYERGLDGRLQRRGTYCYRSSPRDDIERWTTDEEGAPVRLDDAKAKR